MSRARKPKFPPTMGKATVQVGDFVLLGTPGLTVWHDWWLAEVLWIGAEDVLVEQYGIAGQHTHRQLHDVDRIRAIGTSAQMIDLKVRLGLELRPLLERCGQAENAAREANRAIFQKLREFAAAEPMRNAGAGI